MKSAVLFGISPSIRRKSMFVDICKHNLFLESFGTPWITNNPISLAFAGEAESWEGGWSLWLHLADVSVTKICGSAEFHPGFMVKFWFCMHTAGAPGSGQVIYSFMWNGMLFKVMIGVKTTTEFLSQTSLPVSAYSSPEKLSQQSPPRHPDLPDLERPGRIRSKWPIQWRRKQRSPSVTKVTTWRWDCWVYLAWGMEASKRWPLRL